MRDATATGQLRNFHLPLPDDVYQALHDEATASKQSATAIASQAIEAWLRERSQNLPR